MKREIFILGIGGEGALTIGEILINAGNISDYSISFYPFYGSQMRGGESGCVVKFDTEGEIINNPTITSPDDFLILNDKFFDNYKKFIRDDANIYKTSLINDKNKNIKLLSKYIFKSKLFTDDIIIKAIK